ncbi:hypothetical protein GCM10027578_27600 [Spirosoma luteolum]
MMTTQKLSVAGIEALNELIERVRVDLFDGANVQFFTMRHSDEPLQRDAANQPLLNSVGRQSGVYAIWVQQGQEPPAVRYVGHADGKTARQRIRNHFIDKDSRTGSQLAQVNAALEQGHRVGFTFVVIDPPALRLYVEEVLIKQLIAGTHWNIKSRSVTKAAI